MPRIAKPATAASAMLLALIVAVASVASRGGPGAPRMAAAQAPTVTPSATFAPWQPRGTWRLAHGAAKAPLWTGSRLPALNAVHGAVGPSGVFEAWAVGDDCALARYDGTAWHRERGLEAACAGGRTVDLRGVFVRAPGDAWAVGRYVGGSGVDRDCVAGTPASPGDVDYADGCGTVARLQDGAWRIVPAASFGVNRVAPALNALDMLKDPATGRWYGWAFGNDAAFDSGKAIILGYEDDGAGDGRWWRSTIPNNLADDMRAVKILSPGEAWASGESGSESWYEVGARGQGDWSRRGLSGRDHLYALDMTDPLYGWDGGWRGRMNRYVGSCHDDDQATACWFDNRAYPIRNLEGQSLTGIDVRAIDLVRRGVGWLVGERDTRRATVAYLSGEQWYQVVVAEDPQRDLFGLFMVDEDRGWAVGAEGVILAYAPDALPTATATPTAIATASPVPTATATPTAIATASPVPTGTATAAPPSPTPTEDGATPTDAPTAMGTPSLASATPTATRAPATPEPSPAATAPLSPTAFLLFVPFAQRRR